LVGESLPETVAPFVTTRANIAPTRGFDGKSRFEETKEEEETLEETLIEAASRSRAARLFPTTQNTPAKTNNSRLIKNQIFDRIGNSFYHIPPLIAAASLHTDETVEPIGRQTAAKRAVVPERELVSR
jgi:hypothetical protein